MFIYNLKGEVLVSRTYRQEVRRSMADLFRIHVIAGRYSNNSNSNNSNNSGSSNGGGSGGSMSPVNQFQNVCFHHVCCENVYLVAVTCTSPSSSSSSSSIGNDSSSISTSVTSPSSNNNGGGGGNGNVALIFEFLYRLAGVGRSYFGSMTEDAIKSNFVLVYELLDECLDMGYPQTVDVDSLKMYIFTESVRSGGLLGITGSNNSNGGGSNSGGSALESQKVTIQTTGATSWRRPDIKYRKNECYLDVVESCTLLMSAKGTVLRCDVVGQVMMRTYLSGMPDCKIGLNDKVVLSRAGTRTAKNALTASNNDGDATSYNKKSTNNDSIELDDVQFHQCVKLGRLDADKVISFVPPDGEFELMRYRTTENITLPFKCTANVTESKSTVDYKITVKSCFTGSIYAQGVVIRIPAPGNTNKATISVPIGKAKYAAGENAIVWKIAKFGAGEEYSLSAVADLYSLVNKKTWSRPPISMEFQVMMFTSSGVSVRFLKVFEKSNYKSVKWVRYISKAGNYQFRF